MIDNISFTPDGDYDSIESVLSATGSYASVTSGVSMRPLFKTHRDVVVLKPLSSMAQKYDVVLYRNGDRYILHRVIGNDIRRGVYIIRGDNTYSKEYVPYASVFARLVSFNRRGKHHDVGERAYRIYSHVWNFIYPVRLVINFIRRVFAKIYRTVFRKNKK